MLRRIAVLLLLCAVGAGAQTIAIRAGNLIDPATGGVSKNQIIVVKDGKISAVGPNAQIPEGAQTIDLSGSWVLPGLMDAHTHITLGGAPPLSLENSYMHESSALRVLRGAKNAREVLFAGFTALKDIGNDANYAAIDLRRAIERGWTIGPTMLTTGKIIAAYGGQLQQISPEAGRPWLFEYLDADTPDEIRKAVRQNIFYGANSIKLVADNSAFYYTEAEIRAAVDEAHRAGIKVAVHVVTDAPARNVINGGADSIEHGFELSDAVLTLMKQRGVYLVGTDFPLAHLKLMGDAGGILPPAEQTSKNIVDRLRRAYKLGVKMAFGSDVVVDMPGRTRADMMFDYLDVWTEAGVPPKDILKAMTTNCAELFGWTGKRGAIRAGEAADIIALPANPLDDIQALRKVHFVMKDGSVVRGR
jgi:imidazolonepropionase-like amidohydrolase